MPIKANIRDFLPSEAPKGQAWWDLSRDQRQAYLDAANVKREAYIVQRQAEIDAEKAAKKLTERTCQICGRGIFANTGLIAHHGYERPGDGWQTASCRGARELPYETDRTILAEDIVMLKDRLARQQERLKGLQDETIPLRIQWHDQEVRRQARLDGKKLSAFTGLKFVDGVTRDTFAELKEANKEAFLQSSTYSFDQLKTRFVDEAEFAVETTQHELTRQEERYAAWVLKETWDTAEKVWVAVEVKKTA